MFTSETVVTQARLGAHRLANRQWEFLLWAPNAQSVRLHLCRNHELIPMTALAEGYHHAIIEGFEAGTQYFYRLDDGRDLPDPASRFQPEGVHGPSQTVDLDAYRWSDKAWKGIPLADSIFYEIHVGTYSHEGTFDALIRYLPELADLGVTTIELMPVGQFPGSRNWGYDGVSIYAPQNSYGGPDGLQRLVNSAHSHGLSVALDVVYNHLGPEGNYLNAFGPYFTDRYHTPWGQAVNFDGPESGHVRRFFIQNALYWLEDYHCDALRLDAVHGIFDFGAHHFLAELKSAVQELGARLGREFQVIAESDLNDARLLHDVEHGGYALDAQWSDDFHHSVHTLLTEEKRGYYSDFGNIAALAATVRDGWFYTGQHSAYRRRPHGNSPRGIRPSKFVVCSQNHDQVGNRAAGERLAALVDLESLKLAAGITLLSPFVPLLFMGEEYAEAAPFQYFTSHGDAALVQAVREGRRREFADFGWQDSVPDPQDEQTFWRSHLDHSLRQKEPHKTFYRFYQELIRIRKEFRLGSSPSHTVRALGDNALVLTYSAGFRPLAVVFNFAEFPVTQNLPELAGNWCSSMNSASGSWKGPDTSHAGFITHGDIRLSPHSFIVLTQSAPEAM